MLNCQSGARRGVGGVCCIGFLWLCASLIAGGADAVPSSSLKDNLGEMLALTQPRGAATAGSEWSHGSDKTSEEL